jgi:hypothetical protein
MSVRDGSRQGVTKTQVLFVHGGGGEAFEGDVPIFLYHSRDDEVVPFAHLAMYAERLPLASVFLAGRTMLERAATLADVGNVAAFAASDHASIITGTAINITGGTVVD